MSPAEFVALRERMGLTQAALARALELDVRQIQRLEAADSPIRRIHVLALERLAQQLRGGTA